MRIQYRTKLVVARVLPWLAVLALAFASSAQTLAQSAPKQEPKKEADSDRVGRFTVAVKKDGAEPGTHTLTVQSSSTQEPKKEAESKRAGKLTVVAVEKPGAEAGIGTLTLEGNATARDSLTIVSGGTLALNVAEQFPKTLDQALTAAMQRNPDIATAKAKLALAEAELNGTQMDVARKVVAKWTEFQMQTRTCSELQRLVDAKSVNAGELIAAKASLDRMEADLRYLVGQSLTGTLHIDSTDAAPPRQPSMRKKSVQAPRGPTPPLQLPHGPMVERIRQALLARSELNFNEAPLQDVVDYLKTLHKIEIQLDKGTLEDVNVTTDTPMTMNLKVPSLAAVFQWLDDEHPNLKFVVRDYGILVTTPKRAQEQGYLSVVEFARLASADGAAATSPVPTTPDSPSMAPTPTREKVAPSRKPTPPKERPADEPNPFSD